MKMIKGVLFVFAGLFFLITLISLLIPSRIVITRATTVHADSVNLFNEISDLKNWNHWHPVFKNDPAAIHFSPVTNQINSTAEWKALGKINRLIITEVKYPYVKIALQQAGQNDVENILSLLPVHEQGNLQVQWMSITKLNWYPWEKFGGIFIEKMSGGGYESALSSLKDYIETH